MIVMHRRLFWKIYLTLLSSLVVVAILMGGLWWLLGETPHDRWGAFRIHLTDQLVTEQDNPPGAVNEAVRRLGDEIGTDISLYGNKGELIASRGTPITNPASIGDPTQRPHLFMRIDLPDGRAVLVRLKPPGQRLQAILTAILIVAGGVGLAAFPMTARLTRQLESLRSGMARWGRGDVWARVDDSGNDEVAAVARTFNAAASRINVLMTSQKALLANASHELRSPLARLRMAVDLWLNRPEDEGRAEIVRNLAELDLLVEEILLCSRLDHPSSTIGRLDRVDLLGLAAEEAARVGATLKGEPIEVDGSETLLRRLIRNLLENGLQHGRAPVRISVSGHEPGEARIVVSDEGEGIAPDERARVFEPFYRPAGHSEAGGGWGLGLSLVRQIATRHGGRVMCDAEPEGGSRFVVVLATRNGPRPSEALAFPGGPDGRPLNRTADAAL